MSTERKEKDKRGRVFYIAKHLSEKRTPLTRAHYDQACSDFLQDRMEERSDFGRAVGRVLSQAALMTSMTRSKVPTSSEFKILFNTQTHHNLEECLASLARRLPLSCEAFTLSLYYIDLLQSAHDGLVTWLNIERLFAVGIVLASKFAYDRVYTNNYYARVLGVDVGMLNRMEVAMLRLLDFNLTPNPERWTQLHAYVASVAFETPLPANRSGGFNTPATPGSQASTPGGGGGGGGAVTVTPIGIPAIPPFPANAIETPRLKRFGETNISTATTTQDDEESSQQPPLKRGEETQNQP